HARLERAEQQNRRGVHDLKVERRSRPCGDLITQTLAERAVGVEPHDVAQVPVNVLVILRPRLLPRTPPRGNPVNVLDDALDGLLGFAVLCSRGEPLDFEQERDEQVRVAQKDLVQLAESARRRVQEELALVDGAEPVRLEKLGDLRLYFLLLRIEAALTTLDP